MCSMYIKTMHSAKGNITVYKWKVIPRLVHACVAESEPMDAILLTHNARWVIPITRSGVLGCGKLLRCESPEKWTNNRKNMAIAPIDRAAAARLIDTLSIFFRSWVEISDPVEKSACFFTNHPPLALSRPVMIKNKMMSKQNDVYTLYHYLPTRHITLSSRPRRMTIQTSPAWLSQLRLIQITAFIVAILLGGSDLYTI